MSRPDLSVVIGFRDWGADRLRRSITSLPGAVGALDAEIIISDYGSADPSVSREVAEGAGARWVHTAGDPVWSRSRALNAGFRIARGDLLISTDADMLFSPGSLEIVHSEAVAAAPCAVFLQCRDLPESLADPGSGSTEDVPWHLLDRHSRLRPRWGMGGMMAIDREGFARLHGFDERLHTYGREDLDFALRARRAGWRTHWVQDARARMYHMWHPPTLTEMHSTAEGRQAITRNRRLVDSDATTARNRTVPISLPDHDRPLVSLIVTEVSTAEDLQRTVATALAQTVRDIEVLVVETGRGVEATEHSSDPRVRRLRDSAADNLLGPLRKAQGVHAAFVRCGDVLPLGRTEALLSLLTEGHAGVRGRLAVARADGTLEIDGSAADATSGLLMDRAVMEAVLAAEGGPPPLTALSDVALRRAGIAVTRSEAPVTLTMRDVAIEPPATETLAAAVAPAVSLEAELRALLPTGHAAAVPRRATLRAVPEEPTSTSFDGTVSLAGVRHAGTSLSGGLVVDGASYADLAAMARSGHRVDVGETAQPPGLLPVNETSWIETVLEHALSQGAELPIALHRVPDPMAAQAGAHAYTVYDEERAFGVLVDPGGVSPGDAPWLVIGRTIEEVWA